MPSFIDYSSPSRGAGASPSAASVRFVGTDASRGERARGLLLKAPRGVRDMGSQLGARSRDFGRSLASFVFVCSAICCASSIRFDCPEAEGPLPPPPTKISELGPAHVSIVAAMGDSITAAFAARATLYEDRDLSWSIGTGGDDNLTLPYLLTRYSATAPAAPQKLYGFSTRKRLPADATHLPKGDYHPLTDHLNVAESEGSVERGSMDEQWRYFHTAMQKVSGVQTRWKVLTIWMTANDVCGSCDGPKDLTQWADSFEQVLTNVTSNYRNIYINLMSTLDLSDVARLQRSVLFCSVEHRLLLKECGCIDRGNSTELKMLDVNVHSMNARLSSIASNWTDRLAKAGRDDVLSPDNSYIWNIHYMEFVCKYLCVFYTYTVRSR